ncbi:MAG TPA: CopY/TcrY family copper transport repressor, partial [Anaerolineaceae bacterium]|nr:CopY/TcrY family copper transport repressor [Anaerolineaceae bacterium]
MSENLNISDAEWEVMRVVWASGQSTSQEIALILNGKRGWSQSTVKTLIGRLTSKGYLQARKDGRHFVYTTHLEEPESLKLEVESLLGRICSRKKPNLLAYLIENTPMIAEDRAMLEEVLQNKQVVAEVPCDCFPGQCTCHLHTKGTI